MNGVQDKAICAKCGGYCCKHIPCAAWPADFGRTRGEVLRNVEAALDSGNWSIDWWEGDPREGKSDADAGFFVRPATLTGRGRRRDGSWGGACVFLTDTGCALPFEKRPEGGRMLIPQAGDSCKIPQSHTKRAAAIAWAEYWNELRTL